MAGSEVFMDALSHGFKYCFFSPIEWETSVYNVFHMWLTEHPNNLGGILKMHILGPSLTHYKRIQLGDFISYLLLQCAS